MGMQKRVGSIWSTMLLREVEKRVFGKHQAFLDEWMGDR